jgi:hypothetical protein
VLEFGVLGALSGSLALGGLMIAMKLEWLESLWVWQTALPLLGVELKLGLHPLSLLPGIVFGIIVGGALLWHRLASGIQTTAYVLASGVSNFAATNLAMSIIVAMKITTYESFGLHLAIGMIAGLLGAACLTALTIAIFPFSRRLWPCLLMLVSGALLGGVLAVTLYLYHVRGGTPILAWVALFAPWQAGFAAAFGAAVPRRDN